MTQKLYEQDAHLRSMTARVLSCTPKGTEFDIVLDRTVFYPEGGGQPGDRGTLGSVTVTDTHEKDGQILHRCTGPLEPGTQVEGTIDWQTRFDRMQQHSGEHIVSGIIHRRYGWDNVGFHMGHDTVTIDFSGIIPPEDLPGLEAAANEAVWANLEVLTRFPDEEELARLPFRSKKALTGAVRIVEIPGIDLCACCGTHVKRTGEVGLVKLLSCQHFREGVRMEMLCGRLALEKLSGAWDQNRAVSGLLSAKPMETAAAVERMKQELADVKHRAGQLEDRAFAQRAEELTGAGDVLLFEEGLKPDGLRRLADAVLRTCGGRCAVFSPAEGGFAYAMGQADGDLKSLTRDMNTALNGRGGGKPGFVQGSVRATEAQIRQWFGMLP